MKKLLSNYLHKQRFAGVERSNDWAGHKVAGRKPGTVLDVGCGDGARLFKYIHSSTQVYGLEGSAVLREMAEKIGVKTYECNLNGEWPTASNHFDVLHCNQVIEHVHNTRLFVRECHRVLRPGGVAILTSENLCSLLNCVALCLGFTPFSLMLTCGKYLGNPFGLHYGEKVEEFGVPMTDPSYSGITGHNRVLTVRQARELFEDAGFRVTVRSISILPLPDWLSRILERFIHNKGHYLTVEAVKP